MDVAKLMWLMYEQPGTKFEEVAARFMVRRRCYWWVLHERMCTAGCGICIVVVCLHFSQFEEVAACFMVSGSCCWCILHESMSTAACQFGVGIVFLRRCGA
jgi:hypothetical protein